MTKDVPTTKTYPRLLDCHPMEVESMRRTMFIQGYLHAKKIDLLVCKLDPKKLNRLHKEASRAFAAFTKAMEWLHKEMLKKATDRAANAIKSKHPRRQTGRDRP